MHNIIKTQTIPGFREVYRRSGRRVGTLGGGGGTRRGELGRGETGLEWGDGGYDRVVRGRKLDSRNGWVRGVKGEGDQLNVDRAKRLGRASPAISDASNSESRGLFVRPQQVLYVVDAVGTDL